MVILPTAKPMKVVLQRRSQFFDEIAPFNIGEELEELQPKDETLPPFKEWVLNIGFIDDIGGLIQGSDYELILKNSPYKEVEFILELNDEPTNFVPRKIKIKAFKS